MSHDEAAAVWRSSTRLLLVDDEPANLAFLCHVLETEGYGELISMSDSTEAVARLDELDPDLVVLDLMMPHMDGFAVLDHIRTSRAPDAYLPVLVTTGDHTPETRRRALSAGAKDFLTKPLSPAEIRLRVRNLLETRYLHEQLREHNALLEYRVNERTHELEEARLEILYRLARAAEYRDDQTGQHTLRVGRLAGRLAQVLGLSDEAHELIRRAAPLHDIGKIGIPDAILLKPDRLQPDELEVMRKHTLIGAKILSGSRYPLLRLAEEIALSHHERWDGDGYPHGLGEQEIPLAGRIVAVADVFDSLTHERPYKMAWSNRDALAEIQRCSGTQLDPMVVEALLRVAPEAHLLEAEALTATFTGPATATVVPVGGYTSVDAEALVARVRSLEAERDELTRQVAALRRQMGRRQGKARRVSPEILPH